jgi:hypothetical protein
VAQVNEVVATVVRKAQALKADLVAREGIGTDLPLAVELRRRGITSGIVVPYGEIPDAISVMRKLVALTDTDHVVMLAEVFAYRSDEPPEHPPGPGDLARWFAAGQPQTRECLQVLSVHRDGRIDTGQIDFRYEGRRVLWGELWVTSDEELGGTMTEVLLDGFDLQRHRPGPPFAVEVVARNLPCEFVKPTFRRPGRNRPCPCGSGAKAKACCWG